MSNIVIKSIWFSGIFLLAGCAMVPLEKIPINKGAKIGIVLSDFPEEFTHTHVGGTIFNNFTQQYAIHADLNSIVADFVKKDFINRGYTVEIIEVDKPEKERIRNLVFREKATVLSLNKDAGELLNGYHEKYGIDLLVSIYFTGGAIYIPPDTHRKTGKFGLYSRSSFTGYGYRINSFMSYHAFETQKPNLNAWAVLRDTPFIAELEKPDDIEKLSPAMIKQVEHLIIIKMKEFLYKSNTLATTNQKVTDSTMNWFL